MDGSKSPKNIAFFHPDLGIGGAERLVVDAAVGLQGLGHKVTIFTSHCDPNHCFDEARDGMSNPVNPPRVLLTPSPQERWTFAFVATPWFHLRS